MNFKPSPHVDVTILSAREREAWEHRIAGKNARETAAAMECSRANVHALWALARRRSEKAVGVPPGTLDMGALDRRLMELPRCPRCELLLPCDPCLPEIADGLRRGRRGGTTEDFAPYRNSPGRTG